METIKQLAQRIEREVVDAKHIEKEVQKWRALLFNTTQHENGFTYRRENRSPIHRD